MDSVPHEMTPLEAKLRAEIALSPLGAVPWVEVMARALYDPAHGYYGRGPGAIGRGGDFFTAVSVGPLYGRLLATVIAESWEVAGKPPCFEVLEQGAHDGQLMADIATALRDGPIAGAVRFAIIEDRAVFRHAQEARLRSLLGERVRWLRAWNEADSPACMVVCNELLDAFPVHRVRWDGHQWRDGAVCCPDPHGPLTWDWSAPAGHAENLPRDLPAGYTTETHRAAEAWMSQVTAIPGLRSLLMADYGYEAKEYYQPERSDGTLRRYYCHRSDTEVLEGLGACDLTAHINFSPLIVEAERRGFRTRRFMEQGRFLTHAATAWLRSLEGRSPDADARALLRQFHTLTHPQHMGAAFRVLHLERSPG